MAKRTLETRTTDLNAEVEDGVAILTMCRPERRNALSREMLNALASALASCETDPDIAAIVLTGASGAFCAGGDVKGMAEASREISHWPEYDYVIVNEQLAETSTKINAILAAERLRRKRCIGLTEFVRNLTKEL